MSPYHALWQQLDNNTLIVTVNQRLASGLTQHFSGAYGNWAGERVLSQAAWCDQLWQQCRVDYQLPLRVLASYELGWQWREIARQTEQAQSWVNINKTAQLAQQAWEQLQLWQQSLDTIPAPYSEDTALFINWARQFEQWCAEQSAIAACQRWQHVCDHPVQLKQHKIIMVGFDTIPPVIKNYLAQCEERDVTIEHFELPVSATVSVTRYSSQYDEIYAAAVWAQEMSVQSRVAIVVPGLQSQRQQWLLALDEANVSDYAMSGGIPLSQVPIIVDALQAIRLHGVMMREQWLQWIVSPYIAGAESEFSARQQLMAIVLESCPSEVSLQQVVSLVDADKLPVLADILKDIVKYNDGDWLLWFQHRLETIGWPGERSLDSTEYQAVAKFYELWQQLVDWPLATDPARQLYYLCDHMVFQPQSPMQPSVTILGLLEAVGLPFDHVRVVGMSADTLPVAPSPNPFLPVYWQRQMNMPHASAAREFEFAAQQWRRWLGQCQQLYISYSSQQGDIALQPSPLITTFDVSDGDVAITDAVKQFQQRSALEQITDDVGLPLAGSQLPEVQGGSSLLKSQAQCPFQAYGRYRLQAHGLETYPDYLDLAMRGSILHDVLERSWRVLSDSKTLLATSESELRRCVSQQADKVLYRWQQRYPEVLHDTFARLESIRLTSITCRWLDYEKESRGSFAVIAQEHQIFGYVADIPIKLRIDRIDQLADGSRMVIDYKTGRVTMAHWFGDRLVDPQLPLYLTLTDADAAAFAVIRPDKMQFSGISNTDNAIEGMVTALGDYADLQTIKQHWQQHFVRLSRAFQAGEAQVDPASASVCQYCDLAGFCRVSA